MSQTSVTLYGNAGFIGMLADLSDNDVGSFAAEGVVAIGSTVRRGTNGEKQAVQSSTAVGQGALVFGIALHDHARAATAQGVTQYAATEAVSVLRKGRVWVQTNDAVVAGSVANLHLASGTFTDAAVGAGIEALTLVQARFETSTTAAGLAIVELK
jgi:hypothetical protein